MNPTAQRLTTILADLTDRRSSIVKLSQAIADTELSSTIVEDCSHIFDTITSKDLDDQATLIEILIANC